MYKGDQWSDATRLNGYVEQDMNGASWNEWELEYPEDYPCEEAYMPMKNFIDYCVSTSDDDFEKGIGENFYWQNFIDYEVFVLAQGLRDNHLKNTYFSIVNKAKGHCMMVTPWDLDCSLGGNWNGAYNEDVATLGEILSVGLYKRLWYNNVRGYQSEVAERWRELNNSVLSVEEFGKRVDAYAEQFIESGAWQREYDMWNNNPVPLQEDLTKETEYIKDWYSRNYANLADNIFKDIVSGIRSNVTTTPATSPTLYNIMGQRVDATYKGIVVVGGKKAVQK